MSFYGSNTLPQGFSCIIAGVIYHPPGQSNGQFVIPISVIETGIETRYLSCSIIVSGDFSRLDIKQVANHFKKGPHLFKLKQTVNVPTRKNLTLDLIMSKFYCSTSFALDLAHVKFDV